MTTLDARAGQEKYTGRPTAELCPGVAAVHLTSCGLRGTVAQLWLAIYRMRDLMTPVKLIGAVLLLGMFSGVAQAANPLERNFYLSGPRYDGNLPACESALGKVSHQFQDKESTFWNSSLEIVGYEHVRETAFRPWQSNNIPRRYCSANALLNDGRKRAVHYSIIEDGGIAGFADGVEFCVVGVDRNWAFNPACKAARP